MVDIIEQEQPPTPSDEQKKFIDEIKSALHGINKAINKGELAKMMKNSWQISESKATHRITNVQQFLMRDRICYRGQGTSLCFKLTTAQPAVPAGEELMLNEATINAIGDRAAASMANQIVAQIQALATTGDQQQRMASLVQQIIGVVAPARLSATQVSVAAAILASPPAANTPPAPPSPASVAPTASTSATMPSTVAPTPSTAVTQSDADTPREIEGIPASANFFTPLGPSSC